MAESCASYDCELLVEQFAVISLEETLPFDVFIPNADRKHRIETLFDHCVVSLRISEVLAILGIGGVVAQAKRA